MIKITDNQLSLINNIVKKYKFSGKHLINNQELEFSFDKGFDGSSPTVEFNFENFFMNGDYIGIEDELKEAGYRNIEYKIQKEVHSELNSSDLDAFLMMGKIMNLGGQFIMLAEKEWSLNHGDALGVMYKKYPSAYKKNTNQFSAGVNTSQFWFSYLEDANPIFINPYEGSINRYNELRKSKNPIVKNPTKFDYFPFLKDEQTGPDLTLEAEKGNYQDTLIPVNNNSKAQRIMSIGISSFSLLPMVAFYKPDGSYNNFSLENYDDILKSYGNIPRTKEEQELIDNFPFERVVEKVVKLDEVELGILNKFNDLTKNYTKERLKKPITSNYSF